jgi:hypothetical protein
MYRLPGCQSETTALQLLKLSDMFRDSFTFSMGKYSHDAETEQRERRRREAAVRENRRLSQRTEQLAKWSLLMALVAGLGLVGVYWGKDLISYSAELSLRDVPDSSLTAVAPSAAKRRRHLANPEAMPAGPVKIDRAADLAEIME